MRAAGATAFLLVALVLAGCGTSSGKKLSDRELGTLVLQEADLPALKQYASEHQVRSELDPVLERDPTKFGRQGGWTARYQRPTTSGRGPLTESSIATVFSDAHGARKYVAAVKGNQERTNIAAGLKEVEVPALGDETVAVASAKAPSRSVRSVLITWRDGRFVGSVTALGFAQQMNVADVVALARKQEKRIAAAR